MEMLSDKLAMADASADSLSEPLVIADPSALMLVDCEALTLAESLALRLLSSDNIWLSRMLAESMAET